MRIARWKRKVRIRRNIFLHFLLRLLIVPHDRGAVVARSGEHAEAGEGEDRRKAEQREIDRERTVAHKGDDAVGESREAEQGDRHGGPAVAAVRALEIAAAFCGRAQLLGQLGAALQIVERLIERAHGLLCLRAHRRTAALLLLATRLLLCKALLRLRAHARNGGIFGADDV